MQDTRIEQLIDALEKAATAGLAVRSGAERPEKHLASRNHEKESSCRTVR
ncbi:hypothetical protein OG453_43735 [Streptomyces sp. NBC_01381]|nr:hypothetical protein [Streptomyces sp. NBC_01381]MCX4673475.1 hypothetical protein [Streptomyces sp. NBC_01381]